jgi:2-C-methyl-D-erythritol 4-phosphate cytidylyltransferase
LNTNSSHHYLAAHLWGLIPAAGVGERMQAGIPKQFLQINGKSLLEHAAQALVNRADIQQVFVCVSQTDQQSEDTLGGLERVRVQACGGSSRAQTVRNGLEVLLSAGAKAHDWVLVHDAARPALSPQALDRLITQVLKAETGGLLALPVADTVKRQVVEIKAVESKSLETKAEKVARVETIDRTGLWLAQTPQMFRIGELQQALTVDLEDGTITDEASAIERAGGSVQLVKGDRLNLKVTHPDDLEWLRTVWVPTLKNDKD